MQIEVIAPAGLPANIKTFKAKLDYTVPVEKKREGLSCFNPYITATNFPELGEGEIEEDVVLVKFGEYLESEEALERIKQMQLRPGTPSEQADLHRSNLRSGPEFEACFPIAALGTVWQNPAGLRYVTFLGRDAARRGLRLAWFDGGWLGLWWFLAFRQR